MLLSWPAECSVRRAGRGGGRADLGAVEQSIHLVWEDSILQTDPSSVKRRRLPGGWSSGQELVPSAKRADHCWDRIDNSGTNPGGNRTVCG